MNTWLFIKLVQQPNEDSTLLKREKSFMKMQ